MKKLIFLLGMASVFFLKLHPASANTIYPLCIQCEGPSQTYRCEVEGPERLKKQAITLFCLIETAKKYGHDYCLAKNRSQQHNCKGMQVALIYQGPSIPGITTNSSFDKQSGRNAHSQNHSTPSHLRRIDTDVPKNLKDFTSYSLKKTGENINNLGESTGKLLTGTGQVLNDSAGKVTNFIGDSFKSTGKFITDSGQKLTDTTQNTVKCIFSLFQKCGETRENKNWEDIQTTSQAPIIREENVQIPKRDPSAVENNATHQ